MNILEMKRGEGGILAGHGTRPRLRPWEQRVKKYVGVSLHKQQHKEKKEAEKTSKGWEKTMRNEIGGIRRCVDPTKRHRPRTDSTKPTERKSGGSGSTENG